MSQILFANNATTTLAGAISAVSTTVNLSAGTGALFPLPGANQFFLATLSDAATGLVREIVKVVGMAGDVATIIRGQEGTPPLPWNASDIFENRCTAGTMAAFDQTAISHGRWLARQGFSSGDYIIAPPAGSYTARLELIGGGASGGGCPAVDGSHAAVAAGGGSGAHFRCLCAASLISGLAMHVGNGGASPAAGANPGIAGEATTVGGTLIIVPGGVAGIAGVPTVGPYVIGNTTSAIPTYGAGIVLDVIVEGLPPELSWVINSTVLASGFGGRPPFGTGGLPTGNGNGIPGQNAGGGGSGAAAPATTGPYFGGAGFGGIVIINWYG